MTGVNTSLSTTEINTLLRRAVAEIIVEEEMVKLLKSGKKLRLKEGLDPSAPDIHLGHMVMLRKMRQFQEYGHQVVLIVGNWTAQIGDPSGASVTRPMLSAEQVKANAETYMNQFFTIVDKEKTEVRWQSEWFGKFDLADVIRLTSKFTVAQFLARDDFNSRYNEGRPIAITELLYPLMQAYDSVAIQSDVECGGTDQKFNFLVGRELQAMMGQPSQQCFMTPMLVGTDGVQKMSKSLGNYIGIAEPPEDIYGKTMSIRDDFILTYFELLTDVPDEELAEFRKQLDDGANPMTLKKRLARDLVTQLYSSKDADAAEAHFNQVVQKKEVPDEIEVKQISFNEFKNHDGSFDIKRILAKIGLANSGSEANRLVKQGAVSIDGKKYSPQQLDHKIEKSMTHIVENQGKHGDRIIGVRAHARAKPSGQSRSKEGRVDSKIDGNVVRKGRSDKKVSTYQLKRDNKVTYVGITQDLSQREREHLKNGSIIKVGKRRFVRVINTDIEK